MTDYLEIECTPMDEECIPAGGSMIAQREEVRRMLAMLNKRFEGFGQIAYRSRTNRHDFGSYLSIDVLYDEEDPESIAQAFFVESHLPLTWDDSDVFFWDRIWVDGKVVLEDEEDFELVMLRGSHD